MDGSFDDHSGRSEYEALGNARTPREKVDALLELARACQRTDVGAAMAYANEALAIAEVAGERRGTARALFILGILLANGEDEKTGLEYLLRARNLFTRLRDPVRRSMADNGLAMVHTTRGRNDDAIRILKRSCRVFEKHGEDVELGKTFDMLGQACRQKAEYVESIAAHHKAIAIFERLGHEMNLGRTCFNIGLVYRAIEDYETALVYFHRAYELWIKLDDALGLSRVLGAIGGTYGKMRHPEKGIPYLVQRTKQIHLFRRPLSSAYAWSDLGATHEMLGEYRPAMRCLRKARRFAEAAGNNPSAVARIVGNIGRIERKTGRYEQALAAFKETIVLAKEAGQPHIEMEAHQNIAQTYSEAGNPAEAYEAYYTYVTLRDSLMGTKTRREIIELEYRDKLERAEQERREQAERIRELESELHMRNLELASVTMQLVQRTELMRKLDRDASSLQGAGTIEEWKAVSKRLTPAHDDFPERLIRSFPALTPMELKVCCLVHAGLLSKEISTMLYVTERTIEVHRTNARRKLSIPRGGSLTAFLIGF